MEDMKYTDEFIRQIIDEMNPRLYDFYIEFKESSKRYFEGTFESAVTNIVHSTFEGTIDPDDISKIVAKKRDYKFKKKKRWAATVLADAKLEFDDKRYPYKDIVRFKIHATEAEWKEKYGDCSFEDVIDLQLQKIEEWRASRNSILIDFPVINTFPIRSIYSAFETDVIFEAYKVIRDVVESGKNESLKPYVMEMGEAPYFTNNRRKYSLDGAEDLVNVIPMSEDGASKLVVVVNKEILAETESFKMMDAKDLDMLSLFLDATTSNMMQNEEILIETSALAKIVAGNDRPSSVHYDEAEQRCYRMANTTYNKYVDGKQVGAINFLDSALKKEINGGRYMSIVVGSRLVNETLNNKISRLPAPAYEKLQKNTAKLLYLPLQKRRILLYHRFCSGEVDVLKTTFSYNDFLTMINFGSARKSRNFNTVCDAFQEYVDKKEIVERFEPNRSTYTIDVYFYPLSASEKKNMKDFNIINDNIKQLSGM